MAYIFIFCAHQPRLIGGFHTSEMSIVCISILYNSVEMENNEK